MPERSYDTPVWDCYALLDNFGSVEDVRRMLRNAGYVPPPRETIQGWRSRNAIPGCWIPLFLQFSLDQGRIKRIDDLLLKEPADADIFA